MLSSPLLALSTLVTLLLLRLPLAAASKNSRLHPQDLTVEQQRLLRPAGLVGNCSRTAAALAPQVPLKMMRWLHIPKGEGGERAL